MTAITSISHLSWKAIRDDYTLDEYERCLEAIAHTPRHYTPWQVAMGGGLACGGFCIQFGCDWPSFFYASIAAILSMRLRTWLLELAYPPLDHVDLYLADGAGNYQLKQRTGDALPFATREIR